MSDYWQQQRYDDALYALYGRHGRVPGQPHPETGQVTEVRVPVPRHLPSEPSTQPPRRDHVLPGRRDLSQSGDGRPWCGPLLGVPSRVSPCTGTRDCARRAEAAGIPVRWLEQQAVGR